MEIITTIALITINETVVVQAISFLIFLFILNRVMIAPLRAAIDDRTNYIEKARTETLAAKQKLDDLTDQISNQERSAKQEAFEVNRKTEAAGGKEAADIISEARKRIAAQREKAQREMDDQIAAARQSIQNEAEMLSTRVMEKILSRELG